LIYLQVTRGAALRNHLMPKDIEPAVFMMRSPLNLRWQQKSLFLSSATKELLPITQLGGCAGGGGLPRWIEQRRRSGH